MESTSLLPAEGRNDITFFALLAQVGE